MRTTSAFVVPIGELRGACARMTLTQPDQWTMPSGPPEFLRVGVWMQGPNGVSAFCVPESTCSTVISVFRAGGTMIHQDRHFADPANQA